MKAKVKKKGYEDGEVYAQIFFALYSEAKPMTTYELSKKTEIEWKLVDYHLPKLVEKGIVITEESKYLVNPIFLDDDLWDIYYGIMKLLVSFISDKVILQCKNKEEGILNILQTLPTLFNIEVRD